MEKNKIINELYKLSKKAYRKKEIPVSAIIVQNNKIISKSYNKKNLENSALFHAEILCIIKACKKLKRWNLSDCKLYISLEPCDMCKMIIQESRIKEVFYILNKGTLTNKYTKTKYEQMYVSDKNKFKFLLKDFFKNIRK